MRALVIDDSRTMRMFLKKVLKDLGFEVEEAGDGLAGLEFLQKEQRPELILVDWNMPIMNGYEFVRAVRARHENDNVRLMMVTSETQQDGVDWITQAGADAYVMKPVTPQGLAEKIENIHLEGK